MTLLEQAKKGIITSEMKQVAKQENKTPKFIRQKLAAGNIVIPCNQNHEKLKPEGIGEGLSTKINANIGTSEDYSDIDTELKKLKIALKYGADAVMDLSTGDKIKQTRQQVIKHSTVPVGTVPIYQAMVKAAKTKENVIELQPEDIFKVIEEQAQDGVDFITVHCGLTLNTVNQLKQEGRISDIVSRGGSFTAGWMLHHQTENPLYENFDHLLNISRKYDLTLSLGDGMRPGCLADATDRAQIQELLVLGELVQKARKDGVQVMVEGPGHVPFNEIETNIQLEKKLCQGAPFYVLGPLVTDSAPGYDHIVSAIGGTLAAVSGADFLCYVTPAEHIGLPTIEEVKEGVMASRIAAHAADIACGNKQAVNRDKKMAQARKKLDWSKQIELALDPAKIENSRQLHNQSQTETCSMCGKYCALKITDEALS